MNELLCTDVENAWKLFKINIVSNEPEVARTPRRFHIWCCGSSWKTNSYTLRKLAVSYSKYLKPEKIALLYFVNACSNCSLDPSLPLPIILFTKGASSLSLSSAEMLYCLENSRSVKAKRQSHFPFSQTCCLIFCTPET